MVFDAKIFRYFLQKEHPNFYLISHVKDLFSAFTNNYQMHNNIIEDLRTSVFCQASCFISFFSGNRTDDFFRLCLKCFPLHSEEWYFFAIQSLLCSNIELEEDLLDAIITKLIGVNYDKAVQCYIRANKGYNSDFVQEPILACYSSFYKKYYELKATATSKYILDSQIKKTQITATSWHTGKKSLKIKVALEISGQLRSPPKFFLQNVENIIAQTQPDIYLATWDTWSPPNTKTDLQRYFGKELCSLLPNYVLQQEARCQYFFNTLRMLTSNKAKNLRNTITQDSFDAAKMSGIAIFDELKFEEEHNPAFKKQINTLKMIYLINKAHVLSNKSSYDVYIRIRPDYELDICNLQELVEVAYSEPNTVIVEQSAHHGVADKFAICSKHAMDLIAGQWERVVTAKSFRYSPFMPQIVADSVGEIPYGYHIAYSNLDVKVVAATKRIFNNFLIVNTDLDLTEVLLMDLSTHPNQEGKLFVEKYIEGKKDGIVFN